MMGTSGEPSFEVRCERSEDAVVVVTRGEIDVLTAEVLHDVLSSQEAQAPLIVLDLRDIGFMDSSGLSVVVDHHRRAKAAGNEFAVAVGEASRTRRLLVLSGLAETLELVDAPADALMSEPRSGGA